MKHHFPKCFLVLALCLLCTVFPAERVTAADTESSTNVACKYSGIAMYPDQTRSMTAVLTGTWSSSGMKWTSSDTSVVTVTNSGKATARKYGEAYLTAVFKDGASITIPISVTYTNAAKAVMKARSVIGAKYSQSKRMSEGYYDCSSLVWRSYSPYGVYIGSSSYAPTAAEQCRSLENDGKVVLMNKMDTSQMMAGDTIYYTKGSNGRYRNIYHTAMYCGNGILIEADSQQVTEYNCAYDSRTIVMVCRPCVPTKNGMQTPTLKKVQTTGYQKIKISWKRLYGVDGYRIYRKTSGGSWSKVADVSGASSTSYTDTKATYGKTWYYTVRAYKDQKTKFSGYNSKGLSCKSLLPTPSLKSTAYKGVKSVQIKWSSVTDADGYVVYRKTGSDGSWKKLKTVSGNSSVTYTDNTAVLGTTYYYTVKAYRRVSSKTVYSDYVKAGIKGYSAPVAPGNLKAASGSGKITLTWDNSPGADFYRIYRRLGTWDSWTYLATTSKTTWSNTDLYPGTTYYYTVKAVASAGDTKVAGGYDKTGVSSYARPAVPDIAHAYYYYNVEDNIVYLDWDSVSGADGYRIYRKTEDGSWKKLADINESEQYYDTTVERGKTYLYTLKAWTELYDDTTETTKRIWSDYQKAGLSIPTFEIEEDPDYYESDNIQPEVENKSDLQAS
ncbi:MAG: NlpC/P60 family protein [Lachnospiraceae bacterium]